MNFTLRTITTPRFTVGKLYHGDEFIAYSMELPYKDNKPNISCVPGGDYYIRPTHSPKFGNVYYLESVHNGIVGLQSGHRTHILFHSANTPSDLKGCIALGSTTGVLKSEVAVLNSKISTNSFFYLLDGGEHLLRIVRD